MTKISFLAVILLATLLVSACSTPDGQVGIEEGSIAPDFELSGFELKGGIRESLEGVKLSDFRGKVVFLNFWGSWCPPCRYEMPQMEAMYKDYKNFEFIILAVEVGQREGLPAVHAFVDERALSFPILLAPNELAKIYGIRAFPTSFVIDKNGIIIKRIEGAPYDWSSPLYRKDIIEPLLPVDLPGK